jgi:beta-xylosidase
MGKNFSQNNLQVRFCLFMAFFFMVLHSNSGLAQNPIIMDQFTADPTARVFNEKVYLYPSHDIPPVVDQERDNWFCMADYHVFSSENFTDWTDHGVIVYQNNVPWVDSTSYSMWAPDCIGKNGKYYFYFPSVVKDSLRRGFRIGVAIADKPAGPFIPLSEPLRGVHGIDPNVFIDEDGQAYLYWSSRKFFVAKLKDNMVELSSDPKEIEGLPQQGLKEGPFMFERKGIYYMTYPHVMDTTEQLEYAIGDNPMGPFKQTGVIMEERPDCWTNHHSIIQFNKQWYLFYHYNDLSPQFDKNRSVRIDSLFFDENGKILKVKPSLRGVGLTKATDKIQIDRYSQISKEGTSIAFLDSLNTFKGWKIVFNKPNSWSQYNAVDFSHNNYKYIKIRTKSKTGGTLQIRLNKVNGPIIAKVKIPKSNNWQTITSPLSEYTSGIHNIIVQLQDNKNVAVDWIRFE